MEFKKYSKTLFFGATLAVLAGCGGNAATQEQSTGENGQMQPSITSDGSGNDSAIDGKALGDQSGMSTAVVMPDVDTVYFDFDQSAIRQDSRDVLDLHAAYLMANPSAKVVLEGHADERGTREYNNALGERRGNAVKSYLVLKGVSNDQLEVISYGEEKPAVIGHNNSAWAKNRRVELKY